MPKILSQATICVIKFRYNLKCSRVSPKRNEVLFKSSQEIQVVTEQIIGPGLYGNEREKNPLQHPARNFPAIEARWVHGAQRAERGSF